MENQSKKQIGEWIASGRAVLGLELGSTRIKAVLIDDMYRPVATGSFEWENQLKDGIWTYAIEDALKGVQSCYASLAAEVYDTYGVTLTKLSVIGISGMIHGYLAFDEEDRQLAEFRTWRNTMTGEAAGELTKCFSFNIPQRWSIAHLYQAILNKEEHVGEVAFLTTLAGYIHWRLTGRKAPPC